MINFRWPFLPLKKSDDDRIYVRFHSEEFETKKLNELKCFNNETCSLLGAEKAAIWDEARELVSSSLKKNSEILIKMVFRSSKECLINKQLPG